MICRICHEVIDGPGDAFITYPKPGSDEFEHLFCRMSPGV